MSNINLSIGYSKTNMLYKDVHLSIETGKIYNIIGENGAGKSTFYKTLLGAIPPLEGNVPVQLKRKIAIVSDYVSLPDELYVNDILSFIGKRHVKNVKKNYERIYEIIDSLKGQMIKKMSTGQKRMLEIFTILSSDKEILILDEACNGLDYKNKEYFLKNIKQLSEQNGVTIFHTSHNLEDVVELGGAMYVLDKYSKRIQLYHGEKTVEQINLFMKNLYGDVGNEKVI